MGSKTLILIFICVFANLISLSEEQNMITSIRPTIQLTTGVIQGWRVESKASAGKFMKMFKGIPYAQPPLKELRFLAPVAVQNWTKMLDLSQNDSLECPQASNAKNPDKYEENCLIINVFTPEQAKSGNNLPVMVFIHGGELRGGTSNSSIYGPDYLVEQGVIFVSFNYRVGALGFLNLGTDDVPGNSGLKDQHLALQWVQKEISKFGGDPMKVTLFGENAGSSSVSFHYISPKSQGLFSKAICDSGNSFSESTFLEEGFLDRAKTLSNRLNCTDVNGTVNLTCLQSVKVEDIIMYQEIPLTDEYIIPGNTITFPATKEKESDNAILTDTPKNLLDNLIKTNSTRVPLIMGVNHDEGTAAITSDPEYYAELPSKLRYFIRKPIRDQKTEAEIESNVASINAEYFKNTVPSLTNLDGYIKLYSDKMFNLYTAIFARKVVSFGNIYLYNFGYNGNFKHPSPNFVNISTKVGHGDELGYIFVTEGFNQSSAANESADVKTLRRMVKLWTNFAIYGEPTPAKHTTSVNDAVLGNFTWTPISNGSYYYMKITNDIEMSTDNFQEEEIIFWSKIEATSFSSKISSSIILLVSVLIFKTLL